MFFRSWSQWLWLTARSIETYEPSFSEAEHFKSQQRNSTKYSASHDPGRNNPSATESQGTSKSSITKPEPNYSASRIAAFVKDNNDSQVLHRHPSTVASIYNHTSRMATYVDEFDAVFAASWGLIYAHKELLCRHWYFRARSTRRSASPWRSGEKLVDWLK
jgi:hypothetical protein